ncbi:MAG TPA: exodeoxyribonuclease VII small subunit [Acidimicrobiales bacterium]|nr:exodeoxyribonuclease VII small subunit [Acidimicrobiales bacterium]
MSTGPASPAPGSGDLGRTDEGPPGLPDLDTLSYEELVDLLEDLTRRMSSGEVGIEAATDLYEQAGVVHHAASERLARVRDRLAALEGQGEEEDPGD